MQIQSRIGFEPRVAEERLDEQFRPVRSIPQSEGSVVVHPLFESDEGGTVPVVDEDREPFGSELLRSCDDALIGMVGAPDQLARARNS